MPADFAHVDFCAEVSTFRAQVQGSPVAAKLCQCGRSSASGAARGDAGAQRWAAVVQCCLDGDHEELARRVGGPEMPVPHNFKYRTVLARRAWLAARSGASVRNFDFEGWERYLEERRAAIKVSAARVLDGRKSAHAKSAHAKSTQAAVSKYL